MLRFHCVHDVLLMLKVSAFETRVDSAVKTFMATASLEDQDRVFILHACHKLSWMVRNLETVEEVDT